MNFFRTLGIIRKNRFVNPYVAIGRHIIWQLRKALDWFPCDLKVRGHSFRIANRAIANGCGALLNSMGYYDPNNMLLIEELFSRATYRVFFDVGANIGVYSIIAAAATSRVLAFEPHPATFRLLLENISLNEAESRIQAFPYALAAATGTLMLTDLPGSPENRLVDDGVPGAVAVPAVAGRDFCEERQLTPHVLKIDVEGAENLVLRGFYDALSSVPILFIECRSVSETIAFLRPCGFLGPYKVDYLHRRLVTHAIHSEDWVFVRKEAIDTLKATDIDVQDHD